MEIGKGELEEGIFVSAMLTVEHLRPTHGEARLRAALRCEPEIAPRRAFRPLRALELTPNQVFLSFDTSVWPNGCALTATVANDGEGESPQYRIGRLVLIPNIENFELTPGDGDSFHGSLTGENLETIEKIGWTADRGEPVVALPLPVSGGEKQRLEIAIDPQPDPDSPLYVWLRNELKLAGHHHPPRLSAGALK